MASKKSGKRYARAAFELAVEEGDPAVWQVGLGKLAALADDERTAALLQNPRLPFEAKRTLLREGLGETSPLVLNLACILLRKDGLGIARDIAREYDALLDDYNGLQRVEVVTAFPLDGEETQTISRQLAELIGRTIVIDARVDSSMLGGLKARVGDMLIDGSVRSRLDDLRRALGGAAREKA